MEESMQVYSAIVLIISFNENHITGLVLRTGVKVDLRPLMTYSYALRQAL
jgi:hypothetical protein